MAQVVFIGVAHGAHAVRLENAGATEWRVLPAAVSGYSPEMALSKTVVQALPSALTCVLVLW
jgi:hypothetical protein